ncbi:MAG TPA: peptide ABC transporter substrate-binding protein [Aliidongia sp.]|uniref:peptide ABC transporter substrate-binding protein n=1 Tax=Aliidongia sp. TaxID=1914230 RepID=UPI002DDCDF8E|nr:peptide ABC transporter substrate-binding protein [Aliidongia sp.]HEV2674275.1 peptide ABC transporter substrate-binding protein [Aliidongia sp.]
MVGRIGRVCGIALTAVLLMGATAQAETVFRRGHQAEPESLDPQKVDSAEESTILLDLFDGLTRINGKGEIIPAVAQSWDVAPDGLTWTFHLRSDAKWSDGTPVTAGDFVYSFRRSVDPATAAPYVSILYAVVGARAISDGKEKDLSKLGVTAPDDHTLKIALTEPTAFLPGVLALPIGYPIPKAAVDAYGTQWTRPGKMVSNGAYKLDYWEPQQEIRLTRNPNYWDAKSVRIDVARWLVVESDETAFKRFRAGELDFSRIPVTEIPYARKNMAAELHPDVNMWTAYVILNVGKAPLSDVRLRQALAMTIDRETLADKVDPHGELPAYGLVPPGMPGYTQQPPDWMALGKAERLTKAKALYAEAGYGPDKPLKLELIYPTSENARRMTSAMAGMWKQALGAEIVMTNEENQVTLAQTRHHDFEMSLYGWIADYPDPWTFLSILQSDSGDLNTFDYKNPEFDQLLSKATQTIEPAARLKVLEAAERVISRDMPMIPLYYDVRPYLVSTRLDGYHANPLDIHPTEDLAFKE